MLTLVHSDTNVYPVLVIDFSADSPGVVAVTETFSARELRRYGLRCDEHGGIKIAAYGIENALLAEEVRKRDILGSCPACAHTRAAALGRAEQERQVASATRFVEPTFFAHIAHIAGIACANDTEQVCCGVITFAELSGLTLEQCIAGLSDPFQA